MANFTKLAACALAGLLAGGAALADRHAAWDADADGALSLEEFRQGFAQRVNFSAWDADGDGTLSEDEFGGGVFDLYDEDASDAIEEAEVLIVEGDFGEDGVWRSTGVTAVEATDSAGAAAAPEARDLAAWDIDGDGVLLRDEFLGSFDGWGLFSSFDADGDGSVTEEEFTAAVFARYDGDGTGLIEEPELTDIGDDMGDGGLWDV